MDAIPKEDLAKARRRLCLRIGATILTEMAGADVTFEIIAARLGRKTREIRSLVRILVDGNPITIDDISDIVFSINGGELTWAVIHHYAAVGSKAPETAPSETISPVNAGEIL